MCVARRAWRGVAGEPGRSEDLSDEVGRKSIGKERRKCSQVRRGFSYIFLSLKSDSLLGTYYAFLNISSAISPNYNPTFATGSFHILFC